MPNENDPSKPQPDPGKGTAPGKPLKGPGRDGDDKPPQIKKTAAAALGGIISALIGVPGSAAASSSAD